MKSPRIAPVEDPDEQQVDALAQAFTAGRDRPLNIFATLAWHPLLLKRVNALGGVFLAFSTIDARKRELVILRVAARVRSSYEFAQHVRIGRRAGVTDEEIERLLSPLDPDGWNAGDLSLLRFADELLDRDTVDDATWDAVATELDSAQLLELIFTVGFYRMVAGYLRSVRVQVEPELELPPLAGTDWMP